MSKQKSISCRKVGDYNIPNLTLPPEEANIRLSKWGMLHKDYLLEYKKVVFITLLTQGKVWQYLADIDTQAQQMFDSLVEQMKETEGVTEQLKEENQMEWVCRVQNIEARAREIVTNNLICNYYNKTAWWFSLPSCCFLRLCKSSLKNYLANILKKLVNYATIYKNLILI